MKIKNPPLKEVKKNIFKIKSPPSKKKQKNIFFLLEDEENFDENKEPPPSKN